MSTDSDTSGSITTVPFVADTPRTIPPPVVVESTPLVIRASGILRSAPLMEFVGIHAEALVIRPFASGWLHGIGLQAGAGYSYYTPSFAPLLLCTIWGKQHNLEVCLGTSIAINPTYGTNAKNPLRWPSVWFTPTLLVGYRYQKAETGIMYRVFINTIVVPEINGGPLPCLGASVGWTF